MNCVLCEPYLPAFAECFSQHFSGTALSFPAELIVEDRVRFNYLCNILIHHNCVYTISRKPCGQPNVFRVIIHLISLRERPGWCLLREYYESQTILIFLCSQVATLYSHSISLCCFFRLIFLYFNILSREIKVTYKQYLNLLKHRKN